jgi:hypothetical protein
MAMIIIISVICFQTLNGLIKGPDPEWKIPYDFAYQYYLHGMDTGP